MMYVGRWFSKSLYPFLTLSFFGSVCRFDLPLRKKKLPSTHSEEWLERCIVCDAARGWGEKKEELVSSIVKSGGVVPVL